MEITTNLFELCLRLFLLAVCVNFVLYGLRYLVRNLVTGKDTGNLNKKDYNRVELLIALFLSCCFAYVMENWSPFNVWRYTLYSVILFLVQISTQRISIKLSSKF